MAYSDIRLTEEQIAAGRYKDFLGGGPAHWDQRGAFQLHFLQTMGLRPSSRLLDIGCGPLRAGVHLISYLDAGNYCGFDSSEAFIRAARHVVEAQGLQSKRPRLEFVTGFLLPSDAFDYGLAFSVLNHCTAAERDSFFCNIPASMLPSARVFVTHAHWFKDADLQGSRFRLTNTFDPAGFNTTQFGWPNRSEIFPIIELTVD